LSEGTQLQGVMFSYNKHEAAYLNIVLTQPSVCKAGHKSVILFTQLLYRHVQYITARLCLINCTVYRHYRGKRWYSWLRNCAASRKIAASIPDGVIGILHLHNPSGRTMTLGSTQTLTEMSTRNISWGVKAAGA